MIFATGCYLGAQGTFNVGLLLGSLVFSLSLWRQASRNRLFSEMFCLCSLFLLGLLNCSVHRYLAEKEMVMLHEKLAAFQSLHCLGYVSSFPQQKERATCFLLNLKAIASGEKWFPMKGKVLCRVEDWQGTIHLGQLITVSGKIILPHKKSNAGEVDFYNYMVEKGISFELLSKDKFFLHG
ncbi:ComEC/Rec2 family competence protein [Methylacidiphilum kamchatkense]|nr:ComEC/Rec2 family competence protein [Methylacidiphilum kamchatkense]